MKQFEYRNYNISYNSDTEMILEGLIPYEKESCFLGFGKEVLKRGCFKKTVTESKDIRFLEEHNADKLRARGKNGSFIVTEDDLGVHFKAILVDTQENRDLYQKVKSGLIDNVSFGFQVLKDKMINGVRHVLEARLFEISAVGSPAYESTTLHCRNLSEALAGQEMTNDNVEAIKKEIEQLQGLLPKEDAPVDNIEETKSEDTSQDVEELEDKEPVPEEPATPKEETVLKSDYDALLAEYNSALDSFTEQLKALKEAI